MKCGDFITILGSAAANPAHGPEMPATLLARADEVIE
jgi:hypothetical protein